MKLIANSELFDMKIIFDVYPLLNTNYTGIPQLTWNLVKQFKSREVDCLYTIGYRVLSDEEIKYLISARSGKNWRRKFIERPGLEKQQFLGMRDFSERIYFSPHVMSCVNASGLGNARIVHDISSITLPQFHAKDTVMTDGKNLGVDLEICDRIFTVSESSKSELIRYLNIPEKKLCVVYPGVDWSSTQVQFASRNLIGNAYALLLATKEPRKNRALLFRYLIENITKIINGDLVYVVAGPDGWGEDETVGMIEHIDKLQEAGKLFFIGYIPEELKLSLMLNASYVLFPSYFEGFGSPVAEALSLGTPVVCSFGGSLPEVGGNSAYYFSPDSVRSLSDAVWRLERDLIISRASVRKLAAAQGAHFNWSYFSEAILDNLNSLYLERTK